MINWFDMPAEGLSNGGLFEVKELEVTENGTYETKGEMYNKVTVNVEGGGGSSDFSTAEVTIISELENIQYLTMVVIFDNGQSATLNTGNFILMMDTSVIYQVPLYKGLCIWNTTPGWNYNVSTTGGITYDNGRIMIRGDGIITIS